MIPEQLFEPEPNDSSAVSEALHAARAALGRGEPREALRLARQAAEAAESDGDDARALGLARAAADLANELGGSVAPPPAHSPQPPPASLAPPPEPQAPQPPPASLAPPPSQAAPPEPPAPRPESRSPQPSASQAPAAPPSSAQRSTPQRLEPELDALLATGRAVRVLVKRSARDEELYVVRRPVDGKPAFDAREALIVLLEPDPDFFGSR